MRYRSSLRFRIFAIFVGAGLLLGPLLALAFLTVANELEEFTIARALAGQLQQIMAAPDQGQAGADPGSPNLRVFGDIRHDQVPPELQGKTGIYEIDSGHHPVYEGPLPSAMDGARDRAAHSWLLAVDSRAGTTFVAAADQTTMEIRESLTGWIVAAGTLLSVSASLWFGYHFTRRLVRPIQQLAAATAAGAQSGSPGIDPKDYPPDEIGQLAMALRRDRDGMREALEREKAFSAEVAHELRNPLAVIQSTMEIIERDSGLAPASGRALARALTASREMSETLGALLLLGRERATPIAYPEVDVAAVVAPIVERYAAQTSIAIHWKPIPGVALRAPEVAIRMVADNLLRNAAQNTPSGTVEVSLLADRMVVRDTGVGIPPAELEAVRLNGVRGSNALGKGSGLGLALIDRLCSTFGWEIDIESRVAEGTTVTWRFH